MQPVVTDEEYLERAAAARLLRESPTYQSVRERLIADHLQAIRTSNFEEPAEREMHFAIIRAFDLLDTELLGRVRDGERVAERIEEQQTTEDTDEEI